MDKTESCCICGEDFDVKQNSFNVLTRKGCETINGVNSSLGVKPGQKVHRKCRVDLVRPKKLTRATQDDQAPKSVVKRRSSEQQFNSKEHCFFCGQAAKYDGKKKEFDIMIRVRTTEFQGSIPRVCKERNDDWAQIVLGRLKYLQDLHAADVVYHKICSSNFRTGRNVPMKYVDGDTDGIGSNRCKTQGRQVDKVKSAAFEKVIQYLQENEDEQLTVADLVNKMGEYLEGADEEAYSVVYMKKRLQEHFGDKVLITTIRKRPNVVTFQQTVASIVQEFYGQPRNEDPQAERSRIVKAAAKLIKSEIKSIDASSDNYPASSEMSSIKEALEYVPGLLQMFLNTLLFGKDVRLKVASLGQAIMQATRPRGIVAPLQLGLGVQMHHQFASKFLINSLNSHGFCCSYSTVQKYERSAAAAQGTDIPGWIPGHFIQYAADNVDHNSRTLDGEGTFHGMGIVATITPGTKTNTLIPIREVSADEIAKTGRIPIRPYHGPNEDSPRLLFKDLQNLKVKDDTENLDLLWKLTLPLLRSPQAGWAGMMQNVCNGTHPGKSSIIFLPMIDMDPSNMTCIYSTLSFICDQATRYGVTPIVTFDQPLWWKALMLIQEKPELKSIVLKLGGLHIEMSYLGCIGHIMAGSGLEDLLELVYASNAVTHMLSGKAIARAIRGQFLVDRALNTLIVCNALDLPLPVETESHVDQNTALEGNGLEVQHTQEKASDIDLELMKCLCKEALETPQNANQLSSSNAFKRVAKKIEEMQMSMTGQRTAVLWMEYMKMVDILRKFIKGERTGNWKLHLQAVHDMLPYFAAAGHNLYAKSGHLYLQKMQDLESSHPDVYSSFMDGLHVVRRSDRFWAGLSTDLVIEQVLMHSVKTSGGLTRGRGMSETQRLVWVMSMPACADINNAMQCLTGTDFNTSDQHTCSEQHKEATKARMERDHSDTKKIIDYLSQRNPFSPDTSLRNIATGVVAKEGVNCEKAKVVGDEVLQKMVNKDVLEYSFERKHQVTTLASKTAVQLSDGKVQIDPKLLFQRLSILATSGRYDNPQLLFTYEMSSYPTAFFDTSLLLRQANKPALADAIWEEAEGRQTSSPKDAQYILDGGALIHRVIWPRGVTYDAVCSLYVQYVHRRYGNATIVFDGYDDGPSTKGCTHQRRGSSCAPPVLFDGDMLITLKKTNFLANEENKQRFINLLGTKLRHAGCSVLQSRGDADLLIVKTAVEAARLHSTILVGDDTDLLVLLLYYGEMDAHDLFFKPEPKQQSKKRRVWNIKETKSALGQDTCSNILFVHAFLGCDTTSRVHGISKAQALKKLKTNQQFRAQATVFSSDAIVVSKDEVVAAGERALVCLYNGTDVSLDELRFQKFYQKVSTGTVLVQPESLPPTSDAAHFHSLRVYLQIQQWMGVELLPQDWGWELKSGRLVPVRTSLPAAHPSLLEVIRCNCKADCSTRRCSCRKNRLECSSACGTCQGVSCTNSQKPDLADGHGQV